MISIHISHDMGHDIMEIWYHKFLISNMISYSKNHDNQVLWYHRTMISYLFQTYDIIGNITGNNLWYHIWFHIAQGSRWLAVAVVYFSAHCAALIQRLGLLGSTVVTELGSCQAVADLLRARQRQARAQAGCLVRCLQQHLFPKALRLEQERREQTAIRESCAGKLGSCCCVTVAPLARARWPVGGGARGRMRRGRGAGQSVICQCPKTDTDYNMREAFWKLTWNDSPASLSESWSSESQSLLSESWQAAPPRHCQRDTIFKSLEDVQKRGVPLCFSLPFNAPFNVSWCNRSLAVDQEFFCSLIEIWYKHKFLVQFFFSLIQIQISCNWAYHEQLRNEDSVLAQGALIQVQQGLGKHMATKNCESLEQK
jgi:hypothetical protein